MSAAAPSSAELSLGSQWTWFCDAVPKKGLTATRFAARHMKKVGTFADIKAFWQYYNSIATFAKDTDTINVQLFKVDIQPLWEAPENVNGGKWFVSSASKDVVLDMWGKLVLALVGENFTFMDDICGLILSIRPQKCSLKLWNRTSGDAELVARGHAELAELLKIASFPDVTVDYQPHQTSLDFNKNFKKRRSHPQRNKDGPTSPRSADDSAASASTSAAAAATAATTTTAAESSTAPAATPALAPETEASTTDAPPAPAPEPTPPPPPVVEDLASSNASNASFKSDASGSTPPESPRMADSPSRSFADVLRANKESPHSSAKVPRRGRIARVRTNSARTVSVDAAAAIADAQAATVAAVAAPAAPAAAESDAPAVAPVQNEAPAATTTPVAPSADTPKAAEEPAPVEPTPPTPTAAAPAVVADAVPESAPEKVPLVAPLPIAATRAPEYVPLSRQIIAEVMARPEVKPAETTKAAPPPPTPAAAASAAPPKPQPAPKREPKKQPAPVVVAPPVVAAPAPAPVAAAAAPRVDDWKQVAPKSKKTAPAATPAPAAKTNVLATATKSVAAAKAKPAEEEVEVVEEAKATTSNGVSHSDDSADHEAALRKEVLELRAKKKLLEQKVREKNELIEKVERLKRLQAEIAAKKAALAQAKEVKEAEAAEDDFVWPPPKPTRPPAAAAAAAAPAAPAQPKHRRSGSGAAPTPVVAAAAPAAVPAPTQPKHRRAGSGNSAPPPPRWSTPAAQAVATKKAKGKPTPSLSVSTTNMLAGFAFFACIFLALFLGLRHIA